MFPNQQPPTSTTAAAGTSQTATTTAQSATNATLTAAIVGAANAADMPETTAASVLLPRAVQQGAQRAARRGAQARIRPYHRRTPATQATASLPQAASTAAAQRVMRAPRTSAGRQGTVFVSTVARPWGNNTCIPESELKLFFQLLSQRIGINWDGQYRGTNGSSSGDAQAGAVSSIALSFPEDKMSKDIAPELKELLLRVNEECNLEHRRYLLIKALRAFNETIFIWGGVLAELGFFLGTPWGSVASWNRSRPQMPTAVARGASSDAELTLHLPIDVLRWPEVLRVLLYCIPELSSSQTAAGTSAAPEPRPSTACLSFSRGFIEKQRIELQALIMEFHGETTVHSRNQLFAKIICVLVMDEGVVLPPDTYPRICDFLGVSRANTTNWLVRYREEVRDRESREPITISPALVPQSSATAPATSSATTMAVATRQIRQRLPAAQTATISTAQGLMQAPVASSTSTAAQPIPALPPLTTSAPLQNLGVIVLDEDDEGDEGDVQGAPISPVFPAECFSPPAIDTSADETSVDQPQVLPIVTVIAPATETPSASLAAQLASTLQPFPAVSTSQTTAPIQSTNTANMPETTAAPVLPPQAVQQGAQRAQRPTRRAPQRRTQPYLRNQAPSNLSQVGPVGVPSTSGSGQDLAKHPFNWAVGTSMPLEDVFQHLSQHIGLQRREEGGGAQGPRAQAGRGERVSSLALSFANDVIDNCADVALKTVLQMVNNEQNQSRRSHLILKAMRAFSDEGVLLRGTLTRLSALLGVRLASVAPWERMPSENESTATSSASVARGPLCMPIEIFTWSELITFLQGRNLLESISTSPSSQGEAQSAQADLGSAASAAPRTLTAGLSFTRSFIGAQNSRLQQLMSNFNSRSENQESVVRDLLFARIMRALQDESKLPSGTCERVSQLLNIPRGELTRWLADFKKEAGEELAQSTAHAAPLPMQQSVTAAATMPSLTPEAVVRQAPLTFSVPAATTSAAPSVVQAPASPVFTAPITSTAPNISAAQLDPTLLPFTQATQPPTLEELLALPIAIVRDPSMEMDVDNILNELDF